MLKNLPPGYMTIGNTSIFHPDDIFAIYQEDKSDTISVLLDHQKVCITPSLGTTVTDLLRKAESAHGDRLNFLKIYSTPPVKLNLTPTTFYINRQRIGSLCIFEVQVGEETEIFTYLASQSTDSSITIYHPIQKVIDLMNVTSC